MQQRKKLFCFFLHQYGRAGSKKLAQIGNLNKPRLCNLTKTKIVSMSPYSQSTTVLDTNASVLAETKALQEETLAALTRTRRTAAETKHVGSTTLEELHNQTQTIDNVAAGTYKLEANLKKSNKLQDRFARVSLKLGNRRKAKKELKREQKAAKDQAQNIATFKRRGPRPKKNDPSEPHADEWWKENTPAAKENVPNQRSSKSRHATISTTKQTSRPDTPPKQAPLTDQDHSDLREIQTTDGLIDEEVNALGAEVADLLALSKTMSEVVEEHNVKLGAMDTPLEENVAQIKFVNKRMKYFTKRGRTKNT